MNGLIERFRAGDRQSLARILTHVENQSELGYQALQALSAESGPAHVVGLTGPPGAGKSTLANSLVKEFRKQDASVAVLAVDPTSPLTGGAMLGDRIRMLELQGDEHVYLRSMASRGQVGGLAVAAFGATAVLDAFGFDLILIETVGTGQDEVDIARLADSVVLVQTPGMGDSVQSVKAGVLEIADILVVNKADQPGADETVYDLRQLVRMGPDSEWQIPVLSTVSTADSGVEELSRALSRHRAYLRGREADVHRIERRRRHHGEMLAVSRFAEWVSHADAGNGSQDPVRLSEKLIAKFAFFMSREKGADAYGSKPD